MFLYKLFLNHTVNKDKIELYKMGGMLGICTGRYNTLEHTSQSVVT